MRESIEQVGATFVLGYNAPLADPEPVALTKRLAEVAESDLGFAYEGAGMALALLDVLTPWRRTRLRDFLAGEGSPHSYMLHIGGGWALARVRRPVDSWLARLDPLWGGYTVESNRIG